MSEAEARIAQVSEQKGRIVELVTAGRALRRQFPDARALSSSKLFAALYNALDRFRDIPEEGKK